MSLTKQVIHDEANTSVVGDVHKQLDITQKEYERKLSLLRNLIDLGKFGGKKFCSCIVVSEITNRFECRLYTHDKAALNLILTRYNDNRFFFGTRGSPMRVLTGQNVVEYTEHERVITLAKELTCSLFEARTIVGFELVQECIKDELTKVNKKVKPFFTELELESVYSRKLGVYSIGFARYINFGIDRDDNFHLLSYLATQEINMAGVKMPLIMLLGNLQATTWEHDKKCDAIGRNTSLLLQKKSQGTSLSFQQMLYIKEAEVEQKDSVANGAALKNLSVKQQTEMEGMIRVDNTFFKPYIKEWLGFLNPELKKVGGNDLMLCDVAPLFDNPRMIKDMCDIMSHELGIKLLLLAPTPKRIEQIAHGLGGTKEALTNGQRSKLQDWIKTCRLKLEKTKTGHVKPKWDSSISTANSRLAQLLYNEFCLDIRVPYDFYVHLDHSRGGFHHDELEALASSDAARNFKGRYSEAHRAEEIQARVSVMIDDTLRHLGKSLKLEHHMPKHILLAKHDVIA